jgi:hypothetical protein
MVSTPEGDKAIEALKVGDIVCSKPEKGGEPFAAAVTATHVRTDQAIYRLKLKSIDGALTDTLLVTDSHPFYVPARHDFVPLIDGLGSIDVYTSKNLDPTKIVRAIEKKTNQAGGVLVQADSPNADMSSIAARMWGKTNAQSIKTISFQKPDGSLVRFDRPAGGG